MLMYMVPSVITTVLKASSHISVNLDADLRYIAKISFRFFDILLNVPINSYGHVGKFAVER